MNNRAQLHMDLSKRQSGVTLNWSVFTQINKADAKGLCTQGEPRYISPKVPYL